MSRTDFSTYEPVSIAAKMADASVAASELAEAMADAGWYDRFYLLRIRDGAQAARRRRTELLRTTGQYRIPGQDNQ